jgi:hypothetical protein
MPAHSVVASHTRAVGAHGLAEIAFGDVDLDQRSLRAPAPRFRLDGGEHRLDRAVVTAVLGKACGGRLQRVKSLAGGTALAPA